MRVIQNNFLAFFRDKKDGQNRRGKICIGCSDTPLQASNVGRDRLSREGSLVVRESFLERRACSLTTYIYIYIIYIYPKY